MTSSHVMQLCGQKMMMKEREKEKEKEKEKEMCSGITETKRNTTMVMMISC
jgi:hypothetical protein